MNTKIHLHFVMTISALAMILLISCEKKDPNDQPTGESGYADGIFITNEGAFGNSNGSISYFSEDSMKIVNHLFQMVNGRPLGDVVFSFSKTKDEGYIVVNNSGKVEIVELKTFKSIGDITGLTYPRYLYVLNDNKAYLSDGQGDGHLLVMDLLNHAIVDSIPTGDGPENMILIGDRLIVANSGGFGNDSTLTVIDTQTDEVLQTWQTGYGPVEMVLDKNNIMWVLCKGKTIWNNDWTIAIEIESEIVAMDPVSGTILTRVPIGQVGDFFWPEHLAISKEGDQILFLESDGVYSFGVSEPEPQPTLLIARSFYGFEIDDSTGNLYALSSPVFTSSGWLIRFTSTGSIMDSLNVGIGPNQVIFQ